MTPCYRATITSKNFVCKTKRYKDFVRKLMVAFVQIYATILRWRDCVPYTQGAELSALIYAWKDMALLLPAMSAALEHHSFSDEEREVLAHLLYLQGWMTARKSP